MCPPPFSMMDSKQRRTDAQLDLMKSTDILSHSCVMTAFRLSIFGCEVLLTLLSKMPQTAKSSRFTSGDEGRPKIGHVLLAEGLHLLGRVTWCAILSEHILALGIGPLQPRQDLVPEDLVVHLSVDHLFGLEKVRWHLIAVGRHEAKDHHLSWMFCPEDSLDLISCFGKESVISTE